MREEPGPEIVAVLSALRDHFKRGDSRVPALTGFSFKAGSRAEVRRSTSA